MTGPRRLVATWRPMSLDMGKCPLWRYPLPLWPTLLVFDKSDG